MKKKLLVNALALLLVVSPIGLVFAKTKSDTGKKTVKFTLKEKKWIKSGTEIFIPKLQSELQKITGISDISIVVKWETFHQDLDAFPNLEYAGLGRINDAFRILCKSKTAKQSVQENIKKIVVKNISDPKKKNIYLKKGALIFELGLATSAGYFSDTKIKKAIEKALQGTAKKAGKFTIKEKEFITSGKEEFIPRLQSQLQKITGASNISIEVQWKSFRNDLGALQNLESAGLGRINDAFRSLCKDKTAKEAVQESIKKIVVKNISDPKKKNISLADGVLVFELGLATSAGYFSDRKIEKTIENAL